MGLLRQASRGLAILCLAFVVVYGAYLLIVRPAGTFGEAIGTMLALVFLGLIAAIGGAASWAGWRDSSPVGFAVHLALGVLVGALGLLLTVTMVAGIFHNPYQDEANYIMAVVGIAITAGGFALLWRAFRERKVVTAPAT